EFSEKLKEVDASIFVRRGGPNYKAGLDKMRKVGDEIGLPIKVYGPEVHMTTIIPMALLDQNREVA
ncbi:MAG: ATPase, partial [Thermoplasmata archaeon]|nr:ATPase [Thermoplasmata archaeon]